MLKFLSDCRIEVPNTTSPENIEKVKLELSNKKAKISQAAEFSNRDDGADLKVGLIFAHADRRPLGRLAKIFNAMKITDFKAEYQPLGPWKITSNLGRDFNASANKMVKIINKLRDNKETRDSMIDLMATIMMQKIITQELLDCAAETDEFSDIVVEELPSGNIIFYSKLSVNREELIEQLNDKNSVIKLKF